MRKWWWALVPAVALTLLAGVAFLGAGDGSRADEPDLPWLSGAWIGGDFTPEAIEGFAEWRGTAADTVTTYPASATWQEIIDSEWHVTTFDGFDGRLVFGLPLLPSEETASLADVAAGKHDRVWREVAATLARHDRSDTFVRVGLEANGQWFPWGATAQTAADFRAAFARVVDVMREETPGLVFVFDIACGSTLSGSTDRLASLTELYPGDDVVDVVGCDHYDAYTTKTRTAAEWESSRRPPDAAGLADVVEFARERGKQFAVPEWGLSATESEGAGDNPYFIEAMFGFFAENQDVLAFENYFNEPDDYLQSSLWEPVQNPRAARVYADLWSGPAATPTPATTG